MKSSDQVRLSTRSFISLGVPFVVRPEGPRKGSTFELRRSFGGIPFCVIQVFFRDELSHVRRLSCHLWRFFLVQTSVFGLFVSFFGVVFDDYRGGRLFFHCEIGGASRRYMVVFSFFCFARARSVLRRGE